MDKIYCLTKSEVCEQFRWWINCLSLWKCSHCMLWWRSRRNIWLLQGKWRWHILFISKLFVIFVYFSNIFETLLQMQKVKLMRKPWAQTDFLLGIKERRGLNMTMPSLHSHCHCYQKYILVFWKTLMEWRGWLSCVSFQSYTINPVKTPILWQRQWLKSLTSSWRSTVVLIRKVKFLQINAFLTHLK